MRMILIEIVEELLRLQRGVKILENIYLEYGPYADGKISDKSLMAMRDYFEFDDSE